MEVAPRYTLLVLTLLTLLALLTLFTLYTIQIVFYCLNSSMHAFMYC